MLEGNPRGAIIYATGLEERRISRQFAPKESGTLLEYVLDSVWTVADELIVVFRNEPKLSIIEAISPFGVKVLTTPPGRDSLTMIGDAFRSARSEHCLLATERVPLLKPNVALSLFENAQGHDLAIPRWKNGRVEPLLAVYRKKSMVRMMGASTQNKTNATNKSSSASNYDELFSGVTSLIDQLFATKYVPIESELKELDPELDSFLEVKDDKTLQIARAKASIKAKRIMKQAS